MTLPFFLKENTNDGCSPVWEIFSYLTAKDTVHLSRTCRDLHGMILPFSTSQEKEEQRQHLSSSNAIFEVYLKRDFPCEGPWLIKAFQQQSDSSSTTRPGGKQRTIPPYHQIYTAFATRYKLPTADRSDSVITIPWERPYKNESKKDSSPPESSLVFLVRIGGIAAKDRIHGETLLSRPHTQDSCLLLSWNKKEVDYHQRDNTYVDARHDCLEIPHEVLLDDRSDDEDNDDDSKTITETAPMLKCPNLSRKFLRWTTMLKRVYGIMDADDLSDCDSDEDLRFWDDEDKAERLEYLIRSYLKTTFCMTLHVIDLDTCQVMTLIDEDSGRSSELNGMDMCPISVRDHTGYMPNLYSTSASTQEIQQSEQLSFSCYIEIIQIPSMDGTKPLNQDGSWRNMYCSQIDIYPSQAATICDRASICSYLKQLMAERPQLQPV